MKLAVLRLTLVFLIGCFATGCGETTTRAKREAKKKTGPPPTEGLAVDKLAPEIEGVDADNKPFKLSDYRGKVIMLDFWGNW